MADDALTDLVEAFGHYSEAEMQAFLDATPRRPDTRCDGADAPVITSGLLAAAGLARGDLSTSVQAARA